MAATPSPRPSRPVYCCTECGWTAPRWAGRCGECHAWGTVADVATPPSRTLAPAVVRVPARPIAEVDGSPARSVPTGVDELDRVLGGGLVPGSVVLLAGEPGVGKSTLLLDVASRAASTGRTVLYVSGEESAAQVRGRAERIGALRPRLMLAAETDLATVLGQVEAVAPDLLVVDSVQTLSSAGVESGAGGVAQVKAVASALIVLARRRSMATVLVGHVTKDGSVAGPRVLEHLVDVVCPFEGERHGRLRLLRATKNRYGPTDEVGCFDLTESGIEGLADPSGLFLSRHAQAVPGTCVTVVSEGRRSMLAEVQALVAPASGASPRRAVSGVATDRLAMVLAVLEGRCGIRLRAHDVYVSTIGGVRLSEPAADLAIALAVSSAAHDRALATGLVAVGEVGLAGEIRPVPGVARRLGEAARLGFRAAVVPEGSGDGRALPSGVRVVEVPDLGTAIGRSRMLVHPTGVPDCSA